MNIKLKNSIAFRFSFYVFLIALLFGTFFSLIEIRQTLKANKTTANHSIKQIEESHIPSLVNSLWLTHTSLLQEQVNAINRFSYIARVEIRDDDGKLFHAGNKRDDESFHRVKRDLIYNYKGVKNKVGELILFIDDKKIMTDTLKREWITFFFFSFRRHLLP